jgi:hypothetical protein
MPTQVSWTDATTNIDGSAIGSGEVTGYTVGVRSTTVSGSVAGTYPYTASAPATATSDLLSALTPVLPPDTYVAAVMSTGPTNSAWSTESAPFTIQAALPVPNAPSNVTVS